MFVPTNDPTTCFTNSFILLNSDDDTLPEPSNRNAMPASVPHPVKKGRQIHVWLVAEISDLYIDN